MTRSRHSFTVREGAVRIRVWPNVTMRDGKERVRWEFKYRDTNGRRVSLKRTVKEQARAEAKAVARRIADSAGAALTFLDTSALHAVNTNLYGLGVSADVATHEYRQAREQLATIGRQSIEEAIRFYVEHHRGGNSDITIPMVVDELVESIKRDGAGHRHVADLRSRLQRFAREVKCRLADLNTLVVDRWLSALNHKRTRRNYRAALVTLFAFARGRGYVPQAFDPMKAVAIPKLDKPAKGIFTPDEMERLLRHCPDNILPVLAIGAFAGLRQSEVMLLKWDDVHWNEGRLRVSEQGKTGGRYAPLRDNLRAWLEPLRAVGPVVKLSTSGMCKAILRTVRRANDAGPASDRFTWKHNGPRHSFASYRCAETNNPVTTADEMGHDIRELQRSYRNQRVTSDEASKWFALVPSRPSNVMEFDFVRKFGSPVVPREKLG